MVHPIGGSRQLPPFVTDDAVTPMKFSLILATVDRTAELARFLESLDAQTCRDFELIAVNQNADERLAPIFAPYRDRFETKFMRSERGLSRARNAALVHARGDIIAFPDDDCWYPCDLLERVRLFMDSHHETDGINGRAVNGNMEPRGRWGQTPGVVTKIGLFNRTISFSIFLRRAVCERVGSFDESLGLGASSPWQGAEDYDYILRAIEAGFVIHYDPALFVFHPDLPVPDDAGVRRTYRMCLGTGRFLGKHRYPLWYLAYWFGGSLGLGALALLRGNRERAKYHWLSAVGRYQGWSAGA
jgi:glycosyltransferase involved in cell wall biosynthesis